MADTKLADLTAITTPSGDDILYVVDDPAGTPLDRKIALNNLFTRGTVTTSSPVIDAAQTWNAGGVTFTGLKFNATDTASAAGSLLMDLQLEGSSAFSVTKLGHAVATQNNSGPVYRTTGASNSGFGSISGDPAIWSAGTAMLRVSGGANFGIAGLFGIGASSSSPDTILTRRAAANLRLGAADTTGTTAPTPQFLSAQSWASSTNNNQTGAKFTIDGSQGTGTGAGGSIIFRVAPAGAVANGVQNGLATFVEMTSTRAFNLYNTTDVTTNFERGKIAWSANAFQIGTEKGGTGTARALEFQTDGTTRLTIAATTGNVTTTGSVTTEAPTGGTAAAWRLGTVASVSPTSPNRTIEVDIGGTIYYLHAKTTND